MNLARGELQPDHDDDDDDGDDDEGDDDDDDGDDYVFYMRIFDDDIDQLDLWG